jgi:ssDNA-binding Zn-finger/Zn-ribbon topoisomerase 1
MRSRQNQRTGQRFWGCASYPDCRGTRDTDGNAPGDRARDVAPDREDDALPSDRWRARDRRRWE